MEKNKYYQGEHFGVSGILKNDGEQVSNIPAYLQFLQNGRVVLDLSMSVVNGVYAREVDTTNLIGLYQMRVVLKPEGSQGIIVSNTSAEIVVWK